MQRVRRATVSSRADADAEFEVVGSIGRGLCVLVGATHDDGIAKAERLADKIWGLRVFDDADGVMNLSASDLAREVAEDGEDGEDGEDVGDGGAAGAPEEEGGGGGGGGGRGAGVGVLVVSQFTLYGDVSRGRRPNWVSAARPEHAEPLVERVVERLRGLGAHVETGRFRTEMHVELVNDGPVTLMIEV